MFHPPLDRRDFLKASAAMAATGMLAQPFRARADADVSLSGRIYKTLKIGMVRVSGSLAEKFKALKEVGFQGVEMDCPGTNIAEAIKARDATGLFIDGSVCASHWRVRHSDPDPAVRARALEDLKNAIRETHALGGHTVLLVPASATDPQNENAQQCWDRSIPNIRQAVPLAAELGIYIAIENVWNRFLYDPDGPDNQSADLLAQYVDEFNSPWVGVQFDIGNHQKFGRPAEWIRTLGKRIVKLDVKDWGKAGGFGKIGEGDVDWPAVRQALHDIGFVGWGAAEVAGGDRDRLAEVSANMDKVFKL
jgi:L-ribulose-5-phosphate 3-epimerase